MRSKMRGRLKVWGRCPLEGHDQYCRYTYEMRQKTMTRVAEKREWKREFIDSIKVAEAQIEAGETSTFEQIFGEEF